MKYIVDTNILLDYPNIYEEEENLVITIRCLEELDKLKNSQNPETSFNARRASRYILEHKEKLEFLEDSESLMRTVDNEIIYLARKNNCAVLSNDINVLIKCHILGIQYKTLQKKEEYYSGKAIIEIQFDNSLYSEVVENFIVSKEPPFFMKENEFLVVKNSSTKETHSIFRNIHNKLKLINKNNFINNEWSKTITPRNSEQKCLFDLLLDDSITILLAKGKYGSGKTMCLVNYALQQLDKGSINKIIWVPNNSYSQDSRELGTLPGALLDKEMPFLGSLVDIVGEQGVTKLLQEDKLEIVPISIMRGRNFNNSIILVNEAQNLTEEHIKLLIGRIAENSRIFFDGDIKQADNHIFKNKNGLALLLKLSESQVFSGIFGTITLEKIERSFTAQASDYLDNLI